MRRLGRDTTFKSWLMIAAMAIFSGCGSADDEAAFTLSSSSGGGKQKNSQERFRIGSVLLDPATAVAVSVKESLSRDNPEQSQDEGTVPAASTAHAEETPGLASEGSGVANDEWPLPVRGQTNAAQELEVRSVVDEDPKTKNAVQTAGAMFAAQGTSISKESAADSGRNSGDANINGKDSGSGKDKDNDNDNGNGNGNGNGKGNGNAQQVVSGKSSQSGVTAESDAEQSQPSVSACIWPPNNKFVKFTLSVLPQESCQIVSITNSDTGTDADGKITGPLTAELKATRFGQSVDGRRYQITSACSSGAAVQYSKTYVVLVPHDQGHASCK